MEALQEVSSSQEITGPALRQKDPAQEEEQMEWVDRDKFVRGRAGLASLQYVSGDGRHVRDTEEKCLRRL